jgi:hypothetical protein
MKPYKFKKVLFNDGFLDKSVDATYIIHLEGNGRYEHIQEQLSEYHPTNIVYILFNKGYKKSIKKSFIDKPRLDLVDAFLEVFKHANENNYNNILILEDDFIFSEKIKNIEHQTNINNTINKLGDADFIYYLGCIPFLMIPYNGNTNRVKPFGAAHSIIYSKKYRIKILKIDQKTICDWDGLSMRYNNSFIYYIPLCYQIFCETENQKQWLISPLLMKLYKWVLKTTCLDTKPEPGTTFFYSTAKLLFLVILIILFILFYLIYKIYK